MLLFSSSLKFGSPSSDDFSTSSRLLSLDSIYLVSRDPFIRLGHDLATNVGLKMLPHRSDASSSTATQNCDPSALPIVAPAELEISGNDIESDLFFSRANYSPSSGGSCSPELLSLDELFSDYDDTSASSDIVMQRQANLTGDLYCGGAYSRWGSAEMTRPRDVIDLLRTGIFVCHVNTVFFY